jgi:hypothetical protein
MPQSNRVLKFKPGLPFNLESKLCNRWGYAVEQRIYGQFVSFRYSPKPIGPVIPTTTTKPTVVPESNVTALFPQPIVATRQSELLKRCDNIVDFFPDPYNSEKAIRTRLHNMSQTLPANERQFVQDYMDDNFPTHDKGL